MLYVVCLGTVVLAVVVYLIFHKFFARHLSLCLKLFSVLLFAVFAVRYYASSGSLFSDVEGLTLNNPFFDESLKPFSSAAFSDAFCAIVAVASWLEISSVLVIVIIPFFSGESVFKNVAKTFTLFFSIINMVLLRWTSFSYTGSYSLDLCSVCTAVEAGLVFCGSLFALYSGGGFKITGKEFGQMMAVVPVLLLFTVAPYLPRALFGDFGYTAAVKFKSFHRGYIYAALLFVIVMYLYLRRRNFEYVRMILLYVSLAAVITYCSKYDYTSIYTVSEWPLHLCNTIMFLVPLCLIFKFDWLFYFTLFFGVIGALVAMLLPTYVSSSGVLTPECVSYWQNHILAFGMPLVMLFTGVYERPKFRHFLYSLIGFAVYFVFVIILNSYLDTDFFYTNKDQITSLLGSFGIRLKDFSLTFNLPNSTLTYYPVYQVLLFFIYVAISFVVWLIYVYIFRLQDHYRKVEGRRREIKAEEYAACAAYGVSDVEECVNPETVGKVVVDHVYKRYGDNKEYSAADVSFELRAGEIVGFLGHNGAGKSTIIKSIVGVHPVTKGTIEVNGHGVSTQPVAAKSEVGFVPDHYALFEKLTGREYVNYMADLYGVTTEKRRKRIEYLTRKLGMDESMDSKIETYSHGMKQKTAIIAALVHDPKVLVLDEPLTGLDPVSIYEVKECLKEHAAKGNIVFFSTHLMDVAEKLCTRVIVIKGGVIRDEAKTEDIMAEYGSLESYFMAFGEEDTDVKRVPVPADADDRLKRDYMFREKAKAVEVTK
ncbi:MAG: YwaF family protein [Clostridia bacterium]|nr:YwaF family protein [Clostridia bacterium]